MSKYLGGNDTDVDDVLCAFVCSHDNSKISIPEREGQMITGQKEVGLFLAKLP